MPQEARCIIRLTVERKTICLKFTNTNVAVVAILDINGWKY